MSTPTSKSLLRNLIFLIALIGLGAWAWKNVRSQTPPSSETLSQGSTTKPASPSEKKHVVVVTYFTSNVRCKTCLKIEKLTRETLHKYFDQEIKNHQVIFQTVNFDKSENKHFIKDYQLAFKTVVVSNQKNGKEIAFSKYDDVWKLHNTPEKFEKYLSDGIRQYLKPQD